MNLRIMILLFLICAFIICPSLANRALAAGDARSATPLNERPLVRFALQAVGKGEILPDVDISFPTTIPELIDMVMNSEIAQQIKGVYQKRVQNRVERVEKLREFFDRGDQS